MRKWFWNLNLKRKIFLLILMMVLSMMLLEALNRQASYKTYNRLLYEENARILMIYMDYIENVFDRMENITYLMVADPDLQENLIYLRDHFEESEWISRKSAINKEVNSYAYREEYFSSFILLFPTRREESNIEEIRSKAAFRMSRVAGMIRREKELARAFRYRSRNRSDLSERLSVPG